MSASTRPGYTPTPPGAAPVTPLTKATNATISVAEDGPQLLAGFQAVNPALAAQMTGSLATYRNSALAPIAGAVVGYAVVHLGLACSATATANCWSPEFVGYVTDAVCLVLASGGAALNHWWSKSPARKLLGGA